MSIRIGITDGNREFFDRFYAAFRDEYADEFEVYLFPDLERALTAVKRFRLKAVLLEVPEDGELKEPPGGLPDTAFFARLCDRRQEEKAWKDRGNVMAEPWPASIPLLCRYRSTKEWRDLLLREITSLPGNDNDKADHNGAAWGVVPEKHDECKVVLFTSAAGGTGTSTAARGFAETCLRHGRHVLYLDLQTFPDRHGSPSDDLYSLEDVLLSLRGRRYAPDAVLERALRTEREGLSYIMPPADPSRLFDMSGEEILTLVDRLKETRRFSVLVLDLGFDPSERAVLPVLQADRTVLVSNGSYIANEKTKQLMDLLPSLCMETPMELFERVCLLYNRYPQGEGRLLETELPEKLGGIRELDVTDPEDLAGEVSVAPAMERLYERLYR